MSFKEPFEVDKIQGDINQIEREKSALELHCEEAIIKRKLLEEKVENARSKFNQLTEKHAKIKETFRIAKYKAEHVESQSKILEEKNKELKNRIAGLENKITEQKEQRLKNLSEFEEQLYHISELFVNAASYYTDKGLEEEKTRIEESTIESQKKIEDANKEISQLSNELDTLRLQPPSDTLSLELPLEQRKMALKLFQEENEAARTSMEKLQQQKSKLEEQYQKLSESVKSDSIEAK